MDVICSACEQPATNRCNSHPKAVPFCDSCRSNHLKWHQDIASRDLNTPLGPNNAPCFQCNGPASAYCLPSDTYWCEEHKYEHSVNCLCDWYPAQEAIASARNVKERGMMVRRKAVNSAEAELIKQLDTLQQRLETALNDEYAEVLRIVDELKRRCWKDIEGRVTVLRREVDLYIDRLRLFKTNQELQPGSKLDALVMGESLETVKEKICQTEWLKIRRCRVPLDLTEDLFIIERSEALLEDLDPSCEWADRYMLFPGDPAHVFDIVEGKLESCSFSIPVKTGMVWINLPDGTICAVGNYEDARICRVDRNFTAFRHVANLVRGRSLPGLAFVNGSVFIFGGGSKNMIENTAEKFDLKTCLSSLLPTRMVCPRHGFCPCTWNDKVFLAGGKSVTLFELFDPKTNEFSLMGSWLLELESVVTTPLLVVGQGISFYSSVDGKLEVKSRDVIRVKTQAHPIRVGNRLIFTVRGSEIEPIVSIMSIDVATLQLEKLESLKI